MGQEQEKRGQRNCQPRAHKSQSNGPTRIWGAQPVETPAYDWRNAQDTCSYIRDSVQAPRISHAWGVPQTWSRQIWSEISSGDKALVLVYRREVTGRAGKSLPLEMQW